jgi:membrane-associated protease RseP (regulator of RpoE activity)
VSNRWWLPVRQWRVFGATVHLHFLVLIATGLLLVLAVRNFALAIAAVISYLAIIFVHEFGHAAVAHWLGYDVNAIYVGLMAVALPDGLGTYFGPIVVFLGYLNVSIALLNLAPVARLDGKTAWRVLPGLVRWWRGRAMVRKAIRRVKTGVRKPAYQAFANCRMSFTSRIG